MAENSSTAAAIAAEATASTIDQCDVKQGALVVNCSATCSTDDLINTFLDADAVSKPVPFVQTFGDHKVHCYPWHLSTKYYEADIHLYTMAERNLVGERFAEMVNAVIFYFDEDSGFREVNYWLPFVEKFSPDVKLLVCDKVKDDCEIKRDAILKWCIANQFELIELHPDDDDEDDNDKLEDDFEETTGATRIRQALCAHTWPQMNLKSNHVYKPSPKFEDALKQEKSNEDLKCFESEIRNLNINHESFGSEDFSFETLFSTFQQMKDKASQLSGDERRLYAEKVTIAFWKAMGGDDDEIDGLDSDSDIPLKK